MKKIAFVFSAALLLAACKSTSTAVNTTVKEEVKVAIDLNNVSDDKVQVAIMTPKFKTNQVTYSIPKIIPGTYSIDDYGKYIENFKAYNAKGSELTVAKSDDNSWIIQNAKELTKISYAVNDTYDIEGTHEIFSPAGTNIDVNKNFMLNMHGFVGYFENKKDIPYTVSIAHPETLWGATSMVDSDTTATNDVFTTPRYAELVENPIMYAKPDYTTFTVDGMEILISVYSPSGTVTAESITPEMKTMMTAQKTFLGKTNSTKKYSVLLYLSTTKEDDARGFGALEHPTATTVVLPEMMPKEELVKSMKDVVSHEFFHIVTPLTIHSKEIQFFDYNTPKMSEHLWMYEGVTEYFSNLFQINQGLIDEADFYDRLAKQIERANSMNDTMSFTQMSANVLTEPYKTQYINVYQKGSLIGMCIDLIIREKSNGEKGILDLMRKLAAEYGVTKPFDDKDLFAKITSLSYPEVGAFLDKYVAGTTPIPYGEYLGKVGVRLSSSKVPGNVFLKGQVPYITVNPETKEIMVLPEIELNPFFKALDLRGGDTILAINDKPYSLVNIYDMITESTKWKEGDAINVKIKRDNKEQTITGKVAFPYIDTEIIEVKDPSKNSLKNAWLKN